MKTDGLPSCHSAGEGPREGLCLRWGPLQGGEDGKGMGTPVAGCQSHQGCAKGLGGSTGGAKLGPCPWHVSRLEDVQLMVLGKGVGIWGSVGLFSSIGLEEMIQGS